jgi:hypothetical protein
LSDNYFNNLYSKNNNGVIKLWFTIYV